MTWLTWRQFRVQAAAVYAAVAAAAVVLAMTGPRLADLARASASSGTSLFDQLTRADRNLYSSGILVMAVAPAVVGAFWGAPLVARELEAGTHRLAWNQSVTRTRWLATKLGLTASATALAVGALSLGVTWWSGPIDGITGSSRGSLPSRMTPVAFAMRGVTPVAYALFALVLGVAAGMVVRRSVAAVVLTLALFLAVQLAVPQWVRPHLVAPVTQQLTFDVSRLDGIRGTPEGGPSAISLRTGRPSDWVLKRTTIDATGAPVALPSWLRTCLPGPGADGAARVVGKDPLEACFDRLNAEGYRQRIVFQPISHFWRLQWTEAGLFLGLSGLLTGFCFWWTRRRLA